MFTGSLVLGYSLGFRRVALVFGLCLIGLCICILGFLLAWFGWVNCLLVVTCTFGNGVLVYYLLVSCGLWLCV